MPKIERMVHVINGNPIVLCHARYKFLDCLIEQFGIARTKKTTQFGSGALGIQNFFWIGERQSAHTYG